MKSNKKKKKTKFNLLSLYLELKIFFQYKRTRKKKNLRLDQQKISINFLQIGQRMQEHAFPNLQGSREFKPSTVDHLREIENYIKYTHNRHKQMNSKNRAEGKRLQVEQKVFKRLEQVTKQASKIVDRYPEHLFSIVKQLIYFFNDMPHPRVVSLIMSLIGPQMKFSALSSSAKDQIKMKQQPVAIALPLYAEENIIALPESGYNTIVATYAPSDVGKQQNRQQGEKYFIQDDQRVAQYIEEPFKTVKRQGISDLFQQVSSLIGGEFIEVIIKDKSIGNLHIDSLVDILKLLEYVSVSLYTYYFITLIKQLTSLILACFTPQSQSQHTNFILSQQLLSTIKRSEYEELIHIVKTLADRWNQHKNDFNVEIWEYSMEKNMILTFLESTTSEKQLFAVKVLIDRCRKVQYNSYSVLNQEGLISFIIQNKILERIYRPENHPEVVIKGKEVFQFISKNYSLNSHLIDIIFDLIPKSNENICKALYSTLQSTGQTNLQNNREYIMKKISSLPRANLFHDETFNLIEALILLAPIQIINQSLTYIYEIISIHYFGFKTYLKQKILNIYFEVYLMGVEEGEFDQSQEKMMIVLQPFLKNKGQQGDSLSFLIVDKFMEKLKEQIPKKIGAKCKKIMKASIEALFKKYKIHQKCIELGSQEFRSRQLALVKELLELSDKQLTTTLLSQQQLWQLIEEDSYFGRFLSYYSTQSQLFLLQKLISKSHITEKDIQNILESYYFMDKDVQAKIFTQIYQMFYQTQQIFIKEKLVQFVVKVNAAQPSYISKQVQFEIERQDFCSQKALAVLMQLKYSLALHDKKGYGSYPAFKYMACNYSVKLNVINMVDVLNPITFEMEEKNYKTLFDLLKSILPLIGKQLKEIKVKIDKNQKYVTLQQLKQKLNEFSPYRQISVIIEESNECEWYDQSLLISKSKEMNPEIIEILKEIFNHYSEQRNSQKRLLKEAACKIFGLATNTQNMSEKDGRILHLFNNYSQTGEYLTVHEWINFYYQSALVNPHLVIDNLRNLGYGEAFSTANEMIENFQVDRENRYREYFATNQQVYECLFELLKRLRRHDLGDKVISERIEHLALQILKQLPKCDRLQVQVKEEFMRDQKCEPQRMQIEEQDISVEKVYLTSIFLNYYMDNIVNTKKNTQSQSQTLNLDRVQGYCIEKVHYLFRELTQDENIQIDPLKLTYNQYVQVLSLQNLGNIVTRPLFNEVNTFKNILNSQISEISPLPNQIGQNILSNFDFDLKPKQQKDLALSLKLSKLSALNSDLLLNYCSILLSQINTDIYSVNKILQTFVSQQTVIFSKQNQLGKLSNHFVYLLKDIAPGLTQHYQINLLKASSNVMDSQQFSTLQYFKTLNQLLIIQTEQQLLTEVRQILYQILFQFEQKLSHVQFLQNKIQQVETVLQCFRTTLFSLPLQLDNTHQESISTLAQSLLTKFVLSEASQSYLYQILSIINKSQPYQNLTFAYKKFSQLQLKKNSKSNCDNQFQCGIYNLGCTCYINSIFQQLYHIQNFSSAIIHTPVTQKKEEGYFMEFQKILYKLKYSNRSFLLTERFCQNYIDYTGQKINTKEQHDADQFLIQLLDKLQKTYQHSYNTPKQSTIIRKSFNGTMANVITCQNCFISKVNDEEFYVLSLEIKNQLSLTECLDKMVQPEVICDYYCSTCDKKVESIYKFRNFQKLPKTLFVHLQRLVFDLETFTKVKLDHPISFAEEIELNKYFYTEQTQPVKYKLLGFIVHFGNSEGGHYVSLVKGKGKNSWRKYDDSRVTKWFWKTGLNQKDNAYLLVYEKVQEGEKEEETMKQTQMDLEEHLLDANTHSNTHPLDEKIMQEIQQDNISLGKQITVIRPQYGQFLLSEIDNCYLKKEKLIQEDNDSFENDFLKSKLILKYLRILVEARNLGFCEQLPLKDKQIQHLAIKFVQSNQSPQTAQHFLDVAVEQQVVRSLYQCGQKKLREVFAVILTNIVSMWTGYFSQSSYMVRIKQNQTIRKLMLQIESSLTQVGKNYNKMDEYFGFILVLSKSVPKARDYLKEMNLVAKLVHFMMHKDSRLLQKFPLYALNAPTSKKINCFNTVIQIIDYYLEQYPELMKSELVQLSLGQRHFELYRKLYQERYQRSDKVNTILSRFCFDNLQLSNRVIQELILSKINRFNHEDSQIIAYLDLIYYVLNINDSYRQYRIYRVLGIPTLLIDGMGENENEGMIRKKRQRIVGYWSNYLTEGDETIFPLLQLLYTNRNSLTYFQLTGVVYLLQLIKENKDILKYIMKLPSPSLHYQNYISWIREFIKNSLKTINTTGSNIRLDKIDSNQTINKIASLLQKIDNGYLISSQRQLITLEQPTSTQQIKHQSQSHQNQINNQHQQNILQSTQTKKDQLKYQTSDFIDQKDWMQRNCHYIHGEIVQKSQTRLIKALIQNPLNQSLISIPLTYCILKTPHIENLLNYAKQVISLPQVIQPNEQYQDPQQRTKNLDSLLKTYFNYQQLDNSLLQISFSGENQQLLPYRNKDCAVILQFLHKQYPYQILIPVSKLLNQQCTLIVPSPITQIQSLQNKQLFNDHQSLKDHTIIDSQIQNCMEFKLIFFKNQTNKQSHSKHQKNEQQMKENPTTQDNTYKIEEEYPTIDQAYGMNHSQGMSDAFVQQAETHHQFKITPKQEVCIQCPFCCYIAHEFVSRCPGCNQEWGLYA